MISIDFGSKLKHFAKNNYGSIKELAEKMDMHPNSLSRYIGGGNNPGLLVLIKLAKAGCDMNWLFEEAKEENNLMVAEEKAGYYSRDKEIEKLRKRIEELEGMLNAIMDVANKKNPA